MPPKKDTRALLRKTANRLERESEKAFDDAQDYRSRAEAAVANSDHSTAESMMKLSLIRKKAGEKQRELSLNIRVIEETMRTAQTANGIASMLNQVNGELRQALFQPPSSRCSGETNLEEIVETFQVLCAGVEQKSKESMELLSKSMPGSVAPMDSEVAQELAPFYEQHAIEVGAQMPEAIQVFIKNRDIEEARKIEEQLPTAASAAIST
jgi:formylmethanofuran dehydrogenase subunit E-like metal-binding protein